MLIYRWFAKMYGYTPEQVREAITEDELEWFPKIEQAEAEAAESKRAEAQRESQGISSTGRQSALPCAEPPAIRLSYE